jgi:hypothetical protein
VVERAIGRNTPTRATECDRVSSTPKAIVDLPLLPSTEVM